MPDPLSQLLDAAHIPVSPDQMDALNTYMDLLYQWNERMNLTNVPREEAWRTHLADSLLPLAAGHLFPIGASMIDVGTGAGLPGLPIAILRPDMAVTLLDALKKRCAFLTHVTETIGLTRVRVVHARAEDGARTVLRESFDLAVGRAVAPLRVLVEYLLPYVRPGGAALCWKGPAAAQEADEAATALRLLGGRVEAVLPIQVPGMDHQLVVVRKNRPTPGTYPRAAGTPAKKPL